MSKSLGNSATLTGLEQLRRSEQGGRIRAVDVRRLGRLIAGARGENGVTVNARETGLVIGGTATGSTPGPFRFMKIAGNKLTTQGGCWHFPGRGMLRCPVATDETPLPAQAVAPIQLTGGPFAVVCVESPWGTVTGSATYNVLTTEDLLDPPDSDTSVMRVAVKAWRLNAQSSTYTPAWTYVDNDIYWATPM